MRRYKALSMVKKSKHKECFIKLGRMRQKAVLKRMEELIKEESRYCDRGNFVHLSNILTAIAIYEVLQNYGKSESEAFRTVERSLYRAMLPTRKIFRFLSPIKLFWKVMPKFLPLAFRLGSGKGWHFTWFKEQKESSFYFEVNRCIYRQIFKKRGLEKLGPMFCHCDIVAYGSMPLIDFQRKGTLCYGDEKCDFRFVRHQKGEKFERYPSR